ncbi:MAG: hypothetical protein JXQ29_06930 [Planctomycetes bacterium]|nr:hypothetical protein [Planctomycetota bacterium]
MPTTADARERRRGRRGIVLALVVSVLAGCASERPETAGPPVLRKVQPDPPELTRSRIGQAEALAAAGDFDAALAMLAQALAGAGDNRLRAEIQEERLRLKQQALVEVISGALTAARDRIVAGEKLALTLTLHNRAGVDLVIPHIDFRRRLLVFREEVGRSVIDLKFELDEFDALGSHREEYFHGFVEPAGDIRVDPGGVWSEQFLIDPEAARRQTAFTARLTAACLKRVRIGGWIRPVEVRLGGKEWFSAIPLRAITVYVLPRGSEPMFEAPLRHLELALQRAPGEPRFLPHVLAAASLLAGADRERGREALLACQERGAPLLRPAVKRALALFWPETSPEPFVGPADITFK